MSLVPCVRCDVRLVDLQVGRLYVRRVWCVNETKECSLHLAASDSIARSRIDSGVPPDIFDHGIKTAVQHVHYFVGMKDAVASLLGGGAQDVECNQF